MIGASNHRMTLPATVVILWMMRHFCAKRVSVVFHPPLSLKLTRNEPWGYLQQCRRAIATICNVAYAIGRYNWAGAAFLPQKTAQSCRQGFQFCAVDLQNAQ
jgi:hypothetical protein